MSLPNKKFGTLFVAVHTPPGKGYSYADGGTANYKPGRYLRRATVQERARAEVEPGELLNVKVFGRKVLALWLSESETTRFLSNLAAESHAESYPLKGE